MKLLLLQQRESGPDLLAFARHDVTRFCRLTICLSRRGCEEAPKTRLAHRKSGHVRECPGRTRRTHNTYATILNQTNEQCTKTSRKRRAEKRNLQVIRISIQAGMPKHSSACVTKLNPNHAWVRNKVPMINIRHLIPDMCVSSVHSHTCPVHNIHNSERQKHSSIVQVGIARTSNSTASQVH
jgi:hypothetical protein